MPMVTLRDYEESDIDMLVDLANNRMVSRYLVYTFPYPYVREDAEFWITKGCRANGSVTKAIVYNNQFTGSVGLTPQTGWREHCAEIGYWVGENDWGKGIATQALNLLTDEAFNIYHYKKLFAPVLVPNKASMRVLEKCGYSLEGILKNEVIKDDQLYDIYQYAKYCR